MRLTENALLYKNNALLALAPNLVAAAQAQYDAWDEEDVDTYAGGGICHLIAERFCSVLDEAGIVCTTMSSTVEQHVYVVAQLPEGVYEVDLPWRHYEVGGGFSWKKLPGVQFGPEHLRFFRLDRNPENFEMYCEEY